MGAALCQFWRGIAGTGEAPRADHSLETGLMPSIVELLNGLPARGIRVPAGQVYTLRLIIPVISLGSDMEPLRYQYAT